MANQVSSQSNSERSDSERLLSPEEVRLWVILAGLTGLLVLSYFNTLRTVSSAWSTDQYSHGWLIPIFTGVLLWLRREPITEATPTARWCGIALLCVGLVMRLVGAYIGLP